MTAEISRQYLASCLARGFWQPAVRLYEFILGWWWIPALYIPFVTQLHSWFMKIQMVRWVCMIGNFWKTPHRNIKMHFKFTCSCCDRKQSRCEYWWDTLMLANSEMNNHSLFSLVVNVQLEALQPIISRSLQGWSERKSSWWSDSLSEKALITLQAAVALGDCNQVCQRVYYCKEKPEAKKENKPKNKSLQTETVQKKPTIPFKKKPN